MRKTERKAENILRFFYRLKTCRAQKVAFDKLNHLIAGISPYGKRLFILLNENIFLKQYKFSHKTLLKKYELPTVTFVAFSS